jgi:hypothetical protein
MLKPVARLTVKPNAFVFIGFSASPEGAVVLGVTADRVTFRTYPYAEGMERTERRDIFEALAHAGMTNRVKAMRAASLGLPLYDMQSAIAGYQRALDTGELPTIDPVDYLPVVWVARYVGKCEQLRGQDPWYAAEGFGGVGGLTVDGETLYVINGAMSEFKRCAASADWQIVGFAND